MDSNSVHNCNSTEFYTSSGWHQKHLQSETSTRLSHGALTRLQFKEYLRIKRVVVNHIFKSGPYSFNTSSWSSMWCQFRWKRCWSQLMVIEMRMFDIFCWMNMVQIDTCLVTFHCDCNDVMWIEIAFLSASRHVPWATDVNIPSPKKQQK